MTTKMSCSIIIFNIEMFDETEKALTLLGVDFWSTHSSMFKCNWNFQSFHHLLYWKSLFLIRSSFSCAFSLSFVLFNGGSPFSNFSKYHPAPISVIYLWFFSLEVSGFSTFWGILLNILTIATLYDSLRAK